MGGQSGGDRRALEIGEIDMGGEVGRAGVGKDVGEAMGAHGLQRVAEAGLRVTVIDDEGGERRALGAAAKLAQERLRSRSCFLDGIIRCRVREKLILVLRSPSIKVKPPCPSLAINRSRQAARSLRRINCRMGRASTNSLAITISGPSGAASSAAYQRSGAPASLRVSRCASIMTGLVSISATETLSKNFGTPRQTREASAIRVPRPGPSSAMVTRDGSPMDCHTATAQRPMSSPKIWLISGDVMKSPLPPIGWREA